MLFLVLVCITIPALIYLFLGFKSTSQAKSEMSTIDQSILLLIKYGRFERGKPGYTTIFSKNNHTIHLYRDRSLKIKEEWCAALESGEYIQGRGTLNKNQELCCLGVLCELAVKSDLKLNIGFDDQNAKSYNGKRFSPPNEVYLWAGLDIHTDIVGDLIYMNDREHASFKQIAKWIRENL